MFSLQVHLCVAIANRTDIVIPLLRGGANRKNTAAVRQLISFLCQWLESVGRPNVVPGIGQPLAVAEVIMDCFLWEDIKKAPAPFALVVHKDRLKALGAQTFSVVAQDMVIVDSVAKLPAGTGTDFAEWIWQLLLGCTLQLAAYPPNFVSWERTPLRVDASGRGCSFYVLPASQ